MRVNGFRKENHLAAFPRQAVNELGRFLRIRFIEHGKPCGLRQKHAVTVADHGDFSLFIRHKARASFL